MGPIVFLDYDQQALDDAYDQAAYAPSRDELVGRLAQASREVRARLQPLRAAYGARPIEQLDIYRAPAAGAPVGVFVHGGAWQRGIAAEHAYAAEMFLKAGAHFVVLDFDRVQDAKDSLYTMVDQVRRAVAWVYRNADRFGGDRNRLHVIGHSSGAHLGGCVAITRWDELDLPADTVRSYTLQCGMYDLRGPRLSKRSAYVPFTDAMEEALSPQRHLDRIIAPVTLVHGSRETPEFQRQSREFAAALRAAGRPVELILAQDCNHFEVAGTLADPEGYTGRAVRQQMSLL